MKKYSILFLMLLCLVTVPGAGAAVITFDDLGVSETYNYIAVTNQYAGLTFSNASVLTAELTLDEFEFPPYSGENIVFDDGGIMTIRFAAAMGDVGAYFTYASTLVLSFYDATDALAGTVQSAFSSNMGLTGDDGSQPNEYLHFSSSGGILRIEIVGESSGGSFAMDNLTFMPVAAAVPEPSSILLMVLSMAGAFGLRRRFSQGKH